MNMNFSFLKSVCGIICLFQMVVICFVVILCISLLTFGTQSSYVVQFIAVSCLATSIITATYSIFKPPSKTESRSRVCMGFELGISFFWAVMWLVCFVACCVDINYGAVAFFILIATVLWSFKVYLVLLEFKECTYVPPLAELTPQDEIIQITFLPSCNLFQRRTMSINTESLKTPGTIIYMVQLVTSLIIIIVLSDVSNFASSASFVFFIAVSSLVMSLVAVICTIRQPAKKTKKLWIGIELANSICWIILWACSFFACCASSSRPSPPEDHINYGSSAFFALFSTGLWSYGLYLFAVEYKNGSPGNESAPNNEMA